MDYNTFIAKVSGVWYTFCMKQYFKHKLKDLLVVNNLVTVHFFMPDKNFKHGEEFHDFWEIVYAEKGRITCVADGKEILLKQGEMIFHKPNEKHSLSSCGEVESAVFIVSFVCKSDAMRFFENRVIKPNKKQQRYVNFIWEEAKRTFDIPYFNPDLKKMELLDSPTLGGEQLIKNILEIFLIDVMRSLTETDDGNLTFLEEMEYDNKLVSEIIGILNERVCQTVSVEELCKKTSYSRAYLFKKFKAVTGKTIINYYLGLKMSKSKELLSDLSLSVKEVSEKLSFDTPNYFTKTFKKHFGLTPVEFRKKQG